MTVEHRQQPSSSRGPRPDRLLTCLRASLAGCFRFLCDPGSFTVAVKDGIVTIEGTPQTSTFGRGIHRGGPGNRPPAPPAQIRPGRRETI